MRTRDFPTREAAIAAACEAGLWPEHRFDGLLVLSDSRRAYAIAREQRPRSAVYHLVAHVEHEVSP